MRGLFHVHCFAKYCTTDNQKKFHEMSVWKMCHKHLKIHTGSKYGRPLTNLKHEMLLPINYYLSA